MSRIQKEQVLEAIKSRSSIKVYDAKKIPEAEWSIIEESLILSPSSFNLQPWKFIVITDKTLISKLVPFSKGNEPHLETCSHLVVFCAKKHIDEAFVRKHFKEMEKITGEKLEDNKHLLGHFNTIMAFLNEELKEHFPYSSNQAFLALGMAMNTASMLGIETCAIGGFLAKEYSEVLKVEEGFMPCVICSFGYKDKNFKPYPKVRFDYKDLILKY